MLKLPKLSETDLFRLEFSRPQGTSLPRLESWVLNRGSSRLLGLSRDSQRLVRCKSELSACSWKAEAIGSSSETSTQLPRYQTLAKQ